MFNKPIAIKRIHARQILDSRGNPTIEVDVLTETGALGRAAVPAGASKGRYEAVELRDGDLKNYHGKSVLKAVRNVNEAISKKLLGFNVLAQTEIDRILIELDGTENKSNLGANAILGVSLASAHAAANSLNIPLFEYLHINSGKYILPVPFMNIINGGTHAGNKLSIQEFLIAPTGAKSFCEAVRMGSEVYHTLKNILVKKYGVAAKNIGDEGGFAPPMNFTFEALEALSTAIEETGYRVSKDISLAIDAAASVFYEKEYYYIDGERFTPHQMIDYYKQLYKKYRVVSIEDPFEENQFDLFKELTRELNNKVQIIGDDIFTTNINRLLEGIKIGAANSILLKINQIGTLTEAFNTAKKAFEHNYSVMVSHRSGETEDTSIADIAVALSCGQIKSGAPARSERTAKYNQLIRIEERLGHNAVYPTNKIGLIER
ncbi:MAG: phosphopyruvate hydratase [Candidatus Odinarchaeum yellowstonii]|uniref:Enolase n=1 Tax=Odinarchaeota yellowstonii (strain LCB_4) TaxID=1841599 RepID=A0AAF0D0X9_ODILC|nr:MAG: phosphopyruvate hydratase [Candidatus Odinarchaeum yellowstonii]